MSEQAATRTANRPDPRITALRRFALSITVFNILGHLVLGFEQAYITPVVAVLTAYAVDLLLETVEARTAGRPERYQGGPVALLNFLLPAHIAGLACAMLLYGNQSLAPTMFATSVAVGSKYVVRLRIRGALRHVLNPSNLGISVTLILFSWVSIAPPYHFSEDVDGPWDVVIPLVILAAGTMLNGKLTRRLPLILGWVGGFALQAVLRWAFFDAHLAAALLPMTGIAFILFTNYMITDPGTTPAAPRRQVAFGLATAAVYGLLVLAHITYGLFFALVIVCGLRALVIVGANVRERVTGAPAPGPDRPAGSPPAHEARAGAGPLPEPAAARSAG
ncbi:enediyne biosynthesis protein UnbU [Salinispora sp. H7-4]|uniref:enediyne biosynthesis protein UnbU n=1 Tax=Salinispora sp. H7-4 TaxID=2748321 RepID=UPI0015D2A032|nr:enediyne biosynthesis protein UnbU [Salinispora sp. H7-4]NYT95314.1 enediyne biosynthesis protein UnbU [Salinispora sp. H7-4]